MRLDKLLGQAGFGSRNQVKKLIRSRQVLVDGNYATADNLNVDPSLQDIRVSGKQVQDLEQVYYILHKPAGVVSAVSDKEHQTVLDCLHNKDRLPGLYPVGRLDRDTEGLVFLTNNGPLGFRLLHPKHHVTKTYYVEVNGFLGDDAPVFFKKGVAFEGGYVCKPADLEILAQGTELSRANLTIAEGKFHQVKKMFLAYGLKVTYLKRTAFAGFELRDLARGDYRQLTEAEKAHLKTFF